MTPPPVLTFPATTDGEPPAVLLNGGTVTAPTGGEPLLVLTHPQEVRHATVHGTMAGICPATGELRGHPLTGAELQSGDGGLLNMNPPELAVYRQKIGGLFSEHAVTATRWEPHLVAQRFARKLAHVDGPVDVGAQYADPWTQWMVMSTLGLPLADWDTTVYPASRDAFGLVPSMADIPRIAGAWEGLYDYYGARLGHLKGLAGAVAGALHGHTPRQKVHVQATVSNGFPAVGPVLARVLAEFLRHPGWVRDCLAGRRSWRAAVARVIGTIALFPVDLPRRAPEGQLCEGRPVKPGTLVLPSLAGAGRLGAHPSIAYGPGPHFCPGAAFTLLWVALAVMVFFQEFPYARLAGPLEWLAGTLQVPRRIVVNLHGTEH